MEQPAVAPAALAAWRAFLEAHSHVVRTLEAELLAGAGLPLQQYDVLVQLSESPGRRLRMNELADRALLSRSGLSRLVDRMVADGLVRREPCPGDARGVEAVLTDGGLQRLQAAWPTHAAGVQTRFVDRLGDADLSELASTLARLV